MGTRTSIGFVYCVLGIFSVSACSSLTAAQPSATQFDCSTYQRSDYRVLYQAEAFQSDGADAEPVTAPVQALRCMTREPNARAWIKDLQVRGTLSGQLYALVALSALDPDAFQAISKQYLLNDQRVRLSGVDVLTHLSVSDAVKAIARGSYVHKFVPELAVRMPSQGVEVETRR